MVVAVNEAREHGFVLVVDLVDRGFLDLYYRFLCSDGGDPMALYQQGGSLQRWAAIAIDKAGGTDKREPMSIGMVPLD